MRMRRKRYLEQRIQAVEQLLIYQQGYDFYKLNPTERTNIIDLSQIFGNDNKIYLEIGCGKGGFVNAMAQKYPKINFVAVEKLSNVIVEACEQTAKLGINNVRYLNCGAENLLCFLHKHCIDTIFLNFSCPYPKKTYTNRRLTYPRYLDIYKQLLNTANGTIRLKTDNKAFFDYSLEQLSNNGFDVANITYDLHHSNYATDNIMTEYENKFVEQGVSICSLTATIK